LQTWVLVATEISCVIAKKTSLSGRLPLEKIAALVCNVGYPLVATRFSCALQKKIIVYCVG
jgi:hypothetical protein